jgi:hypothetical protein
LPIAFASLRIASRGAQLRSGGVVALGMVLRTTSLNPRAP